MKGSIFEADGPVLLRDTPLTIADAALSLGYDDPYQLSPAQLGEAVTLLEKKKDGRSYWRDPIQVIEGFAGGATMGQATPYVLDGMAGAGLDVAQAEGPATGWVMSWMVSARAAHPGCAQELAGIFAAAPGAARGRLVDGHRAGRTRRRARTRTPRRPRRPTRASSGAASRRLCDEHRSKGVVFATFPAKDCGGDEGSCTAYEDWIKAWDALKEQ